MIIFREDFKKTLALFKETLKETKFISIDCEMTGVTHDISTDGTKYDTAEIRYHKQRKIVQMFDLIQVGITCYIESKTKDNQEFYLERTFTFYLFKNSKLSWLIEQYPNDSKYNIFNSYLNCHPLAIKFLSDNSFNFNLMFSRGLHYNKFNYRNKIENLINEHETNGSLPNSVIHLSSQNQSIVVTFAKHLVNILISNENKKKFEYLDVKDDFLLNYIIGINWKKVARIANFSVRRDKTNPFMIIIEKSKVKLDSKDFIEFWKTVGDFNSKISYDDIFNARHSQFIIEKDKSFNPADTVNEEIGFSLFIEAMVEMRLPIIGHNAFLDILFLYDKCIDDLPEDYHKFKENMHKYFPVIVDTRYIVNKYELIFEKRGLNNIFKKALDSHFDKYIEVLSDLKNGFGYYCGSDVYHDAGFDSLITGKILIYVLKAIENDFAIENKKESKIETKDKVIAEHKAINIKKGYIDFNILNKFCNKINFSIVSEVDKLRKNDICFNFNLERKDDLSEKIDFENTFYVEFNKDVDIYEVAKIFTNDDWNLNVVLARENAAFIEYFSDKIITKEELEKIIFGNTNPNIFTKDVKFIIEYQTYMKDYQKYLNIYGK